MKTTQELVTDILQEYSRRIENGEEYATILDRETYDYSAFSYIQKYYSQDQKEEFCQRGLFFNAGYF